MNNKIFKVTTKVITTVLSIITVLLMLLALYNFFSVKILKKDYPNLFGYTFFEVISGSMSPTIEKMDVILVKLDTNYEVGDIVSYKNDGAIITHRIVEKNGTTYITKGDANNTIDKPINEEKIIGKVINTYGGLAIWIKVLTDPKVAFGAIISFILLGYTISLFKKQEKTEINKIDEDNKIKREEIMKKILSNTKLKIEICILFILLIALLVLVPYTLSRFKTQASGVASVDIAFFVANDQYTHQQLTLNEMIPGDTYSYTFSVSNYKDEDRTEVNLSYYLEIITTTNLPLEYEVDLINSTPVDISTSNTVVQDNDGTYFRNILTQTREFGFVSNTTDTYRLTVIFPIEHKMAKYQDTVENIEINVHARQKLDSDN